MRWVALFALGGCSQIFGLQAPVVAGDGGTDSVRDGADAADAPPDIAGHFCYGAAPFIECLTSAPIGDISVGSMVMDTSQGASCSVIDSQLGTETCVVVHHSLTISASWIATGSRPLAIVGDTIVINAGATLDVSAMGTLAGAGHDPP